MTLPQMMQAIRYDRYGAADVMRLVRVPKPRPSPTEVLVRVLGAGVNPIDWKVRRGGSGFTEKDLPIIPGWEISGVVEAVAPGVTRFRPGDEVYGMPRFPWPASAYAEFATARARQLALKPGAIDHPHAAGLPVAGLTAWQALIDTARLQVGQCVLIRGAAGGVGHLAVQIAKAHGAYVVSTARRDQWGFLEHLGADAVFDDREADLLPEWAKSFDVVFDVVGGDGAVASLGAVRARGMLIALNWPNHLELAAMAADRGVRATGLLVEPDHAALEQLSRLVDEGRVRVHVDRSLSLDHAVDAHLLGEAGGRRGKIVLNVP